MSLRVVVLVSGSGTLLQSLLDAHLPGVEIVGVGSDVADCVGLQRAEKAGVTTFVVEMPTLVKRGTPERRDWDQRLADAIAACAPDLVVLAGFMKLFDEPCLAAFGGKIINSHPALPGEFPGAHAVRDAIAAGVDRTGCCVFWVDAGVDTGAVIASERIAIIPGDSEETLHERIKIVERRLLVDAVAHLAKEHND